VPLLIDLLLLNAFDALPARCIGSQHRDMPHFFPFMMLATQTPEKHRQRRYPTLLLPWSFRKLVH